MLLASSNKIVALYTVVWQRTAQYSSKVILYIDRYSLFIIYAVISLLLLCILNISVFRYFSFKQTKEQNSQVAIYSDIFTKLILKELQQTQNNLYNTGLFCSCKPFKKMFELKKIIIDNKTIFCDARLIKETLDQAIPSYVYYKVSINDEIIASNIHYHHKIMKQVTTPIFKDKLLNISIGLDEYSYYVKNLNSKVNKKISKIYLISSLIWITTLPIIAYIFYIFERLKAENQRLRKETQKFEIIRRAEHQAKLFTDKFYKYSKHIKNLYHQINLISNDTIPSLESEDYLPLPLIEPQTSSNNFEVILEEVIEEVKTLIAGYVALHSYNIDFTYELKVSKLSLPFNQTLFDQIIIGLISNVIYFAKDKKHTRYIHFTVDQEQIVLKHNAFSLTQEMMIDYCQRIFYETRNPYILSFGQIFIIFNKLYNLKCEAYHYAKENIIMLNLKKEVNNNVISLKKYKKS